MYIISADHSFAPMQQDFIITDIVYLRVKQHRNMHRSRSRYQIKTKHNIYPLHMMLHTKHNSLINKAQFRI